MTPFLALLSAYYLCDAAAAAAPLPPAVAQTCAARYEAVKTTFLNAGETGPDARTLSYLRFKAWEAANPKVVARLKAQARDELARHDLAALLPGTSS